MNAAEADLNIPQMDLVTPLHLAAIKNNKEVRPLLFSNSNSGGVQVFWNRPGHHLELAWSPPAADGNWPGG